MIVKYLTRFPIFYNNKEKRPDSKFKINRSRNLHLLNIKNRKWKKGRRKKSWEIQMIYGKVLMVNNNSYKIKI